MSAVETLGTIVGLEDLNYITQKSEIKQIEKRIHSNYKILKKMNNKYLERLMKIYEKNIINEIEECESKCDAFSNLLVHLTKLTSNNSMFDRNDEKDILKEYQNLQDKIKELKQLLI
tara:strand:- start:534 stop:884 length:351 start_codon:yes stop_codon:yes gene_type:complete